MINRSKITLILFLSLMIVTCANASPTVLNSSLNISPDAAIIAPDSSSVILPNSVFSVEFEKVHFASLAEDFIKPPSHEVDHPKLTSTRALPALPATSALVLVGFLTITIVRDRRSWLGVIEGSFKAGSVGLDILPKLAYILCKRNIFDNLILTAKLNLHHFGNSIRLRSDLEGTSYIALLRSIAGIPDGMKVSLVFSPVANSTSLPAAYQSHFNNSSHSLAFNSSDTGLLPIIIKKWSNISVVVVSLLKRRKNFLK